MDQLKAKVDEPVEGPYRDRYVTVPNIICALRLVGAFALIGIALAGRSQLFTWLFVCLSLSDWIDGKLARWLNQRSVFGARLDSFADATLYGALIIGIGVLKWDVLQGQLLWVIMATASYALTTGAGLWKFGKVPSYHTWGAKTSQWVILAGAVCLLLNLAIWPFQLAMVCVTLTNLEATALTFVLDEWRADVLSILHVLPERGRQGKP